MGDAMTRQKRRRRVGARGIIQHCRSDNGRLVKSLADKRRAEFWLEPDGIRVREFQAHRAIFSGEAMTAKKRAKPSKYERLHYLLGALGDSTIDRDEFWRLMAEQRLTDDDIDAYCSGDISAEIPEGFLR